MDESTQPRIVIADLLGRLNLATFEALRQTRKPAPETTPLCFPNGCPILSEGPQRDDL